MALFIDLKYVNIVSVRFEKIVKKDDYLWNLRCPICGDSKKNHNKMRGYIYRKQNDLFYRCHNCGVGMSIGNLIKSMDANLYKEYILDRYKNGDNGHSNYQKPTFDISPTKFGKIDKVSYDNAEFCDKLPENHSCIQYLLNRKIPRDKWNKLLYADHYKNFCDEINPNHGKTIDNDKRLVIPYYSEYGVLLGVSGRALEASSEKLRYVTIRINDSKQPLIYGLDDLDVTKRVYIVEGPLDSLFINNCVAAGSTALLQTANNLSATDKVLIFDREPRNKEVIQIMKGAIDAGENVVIWPDDLEGKDINEMIMHGYDVISVINQNIFSGLEAQMKFTFYKKV